MMDKNPLVWMGEVNDYLVDLRNMPREVQEIAFEKGMIPSIPLDDRGDHFGRPATLSLHGLAQAPDRSGGRIFLTSCRVSASLRTKN
jgi:hypothetical protein